MSNEQKHRMVVKGLNKTFRDSKQVVEVLRAVSFDVRIGEVMAIVGPSGCGKTTLLRILGGLIRPNDGHVLLDGEPIINPSRKIAYMFQEDSLFPWKTAIRNVSFALEAQGHPRREAIARAAEYLRLVDLEDFSDFYPHQLSGGMKQRVALARSLVTEPEILLMDEPLATLDPQLREALQEQIAKVRLQLQCTIVLVSHDIDEIVFLSDRVLMLTKRPAQVRARMDIPLPAAREAAIRAQTRFAEVRAQIWQQLRDEGCEEALSTPGGK